MKKDPNRMETDLAGHHRNKKELKPPLARIPNMRPSSWKDERLPEMLWAVLAIGNWDRENALAFFRHVALFVRDNNDCSDVTLSGIGKFSHEKREEFIEWLLSYSPGVKDLLRPLSLFPDLPGVPEWSKHLDAPKPEDDWVKISKGIVKVLDHQSQEATDCRWIKLFCFILGGKMKFPRQMEDDLRGVFEYPNYGDLRKIRPFIRSAEIIQKTTEGDLEVSPWSGFFWTTCHSHTACVPEGMHKKPWERDELWNKKREHYLTESVRVRALLVDHYLVTANTTAVDYRHEACFGFALYGVILFSEINLYRTNFSIAGRLSLRALVENFITFSYLLKKDDKELWKSYRAYGAGQAKLVYLKLQGLNKKPSSVDEEMMQRIANEDSWQEFVSINLGHWDNTSLRQMSDEAGLKDLYDQYYSWTSGYIHSTWAAIRETVFETCFNPLHRLHRHPSVNFPKLHNAIEDSLELVNSILSLLDRAYPKFPERLKFYDVQATSGTDSEEKAGK